MTCVCLLHQVNKSEATTHILACAPSNSACDLLCERLLGYVDGHRLYRLYAPSRDPKAVPQKLLVRHMHGVCLEMPNYHSNRILWSMCHVHKCSVYMEYADDMQKNTIQEYNAMHFDSWLTNDYWIYLNIIIFCYILIKCKQNINKNIT